MLNIMFITSTVFVFIAYHIAAQDYEAAPPWEEPSGDSYVSPPEYVAPYPSDPGVGPSVRDSSPDFPDISNTQNTDQSYPSSYGSPPAYGSPSSYGSPAYTYDDEGPGLTRQSTSTTTICFCAPVGTCVNGSTNLGEGNIDVRVGGTTSQAASESQQRPIVTTTAPARITSCSSSALQLCCTPGPYQCGIAWPAVRGSANASSGQAYFGQYPWQVVLLDRSDTYLGSGALIDNYNVVTAAHKVARYASSGGVKVRLGEWDSAGNREPIPAQEFSVTRIVIHPSFNAQNLRNSIAMLRLSAAVPLGMTPTINNICLPSSKFISGTCFVSGWGKNDFRTGSYQAIQRSTDLPLVPTNTCQSQLRNTRLGPSFLLDPFSFMCAGGKAGKDACTGDGGAPLVCQQGGKWYLAGLVAWGISCGDSNVPGVYMNITNYIPWMMNLTRS